MLRAQADDGSTSVLKSIWTSSRRAQPGGLLLASRVTGGVAGLGERE